MTPMCRRGSERGGSTEHGSVALFRGMIWLDQRRSTFHSDRNRENVTRRGPKKEPEEFNMAAASWQLISAHDVDTVLEAYGADTRTLNGISEMFSPLRMVRLTVWLNTRTSY